jgi:hypothetical protein
LYKGRGNHGDHHHHLKSLESFSSSPFCWREEGASAVDEGSWNSGIYFPVCVLYSERPAGEFPHREPPPTPHYAQLELLL